MAIKTPESELQLPIAPHDLVDTAEHTASGLTPGQALRATGATSYGFGNAAKEIFIDASAPSAPGSGLTVIYTVSGKPRYRAGAAGADTGLADAIHNLVDTTNHPVSGLTTDHVLKATGAATYGFGALPTHGIGSHTDRSLNFSIGAAALGAVEGSPTLGTDTGSRWPCWLLDDTATEAIGGAFAVPDNWTSGTISARVWMASRGIQSSKAVRMNWQAVGQLAHSSALTAAFSTNTTVNVFDTAELMVVWDPAQAITVTAGCLMTFRIGRNGSNVEDTASGDLEIFAVEFTFTADQ